MAPEAGLGAGCVGVENGELYRQIIQTSHEGIWMSDLEGVTTFANPQMARMLGVTAEEMVGRTVFEFVFRDDYPVVRGHFAEFLQAPVGREVEERLRRKDGTALWTLVAASAFRDGKGRPAGFVGMFSDITDRKRAEEALRRNMDTLEVRVRERTAELEASHRALVEGEEKYRRLFETISDGALVFDAETLQVIEVNEAALRLYGYTREEFLRLTLWAITAEPEDSEAAIRLTVAGVAPRIPLRYHRKKDGTIFPVEISASTFKLNGRDMVCGMVRDITARKQAEESLRRRDQELFDLEREILAVSEQEQRRLGQDLHDDLCQQLAGIEFLSQTLAGKLAARHAAGAAEAREISRMVRRAMTQTREMASGLCPVPLEAEGLTDALRELAARTRKVFRLDCAFRCEAPVLVSDHAVATHLYRLAQEAVHNAVKHAQASRVEIALTTNGTGLVLTVRDNGVGLRAKRGKCKGLGLRIMRYRAEVIGGSLAVEQNPEGGTAVICAVPERPPTAGLR